MIYVDAYDDSDDNDKPSSIALTAASTSDAFDTKSSISLFLTPVRLSRSSNRVGSIFLSLSLSFYHVICTQLTEAEATTMLILTTEAATTTTLTTTVTMLTTTTLTTITTLTTTTI